MGAGAGFDAPGLVGDAPIAVETRKLGEEVGGGMRRNAAAPVGAGIGGG